MKSILIILFFIFFAKAYIDPVLNQQRLAIIPQFLTKSMETIAYNRGNLTMYTAPDYCSIIPAEKILCGLAENLAFTAIHFLQVPIYNSQTNTVEYYRTDIFSVKVLDISLYIDGSTKDVYVAKFILNNKQFNSETISYQIQDGLFYNIYYVFQKGSPKISAEVFLSDDGYKFNQASQQNPDLNTLCYLITQLGCPVGSQYQNYNSMEDCVAKMTLINQQNQQLKDGGCPDTQLSNTTSCRILYAVASITTPPDSQNIFCPYTSIPSTHCIDNCKSVCDTCDPNAACDFDVNVFGVKTYSCKCKPGYVGNGLQCSAKTCTAQYQCATGNNYNYVACNTTTNFCHCQPSFIWNGVTGNCECPANHSIWWDNGSPLCLSTGRCLDRTQCTNQGYNSSGNAQTVIGQWNQLQCVPVGPLTDLFPYKTCVCNYGYNGGYFIPCDCPAPKKEKWSPLINGNVCLSSNECVASYDCPYGQVCQIDDKTNVGVCVSSKNSVKRPVEEKFSKSRPTERYPSISRKLYSKIRK